MPHPTPPTQNKPLPLAEKVAILRTKQIDAIAGVLAATELTIAAFQTRVDPRTNEYAPIDPQYTDYRDMLRRELEKVKQRLGSEVIHIDELKKLRELDRLNYKL